MVKLIRVKDCLTSLRKVTVSHRQTILILLGITSFYFFLVLSYSKGSLYIGSDNSGSYSLSYTMINFSIYQIFFPVAYIISAGNIYLTFNIQLFLNMFLTLSSIFFLTSVFFKGYFDKKKVILIGTIASFIYPLNIGAINVVWQTFLNSFQPPTAFLIFFIAIVVRISRNILSHEEVKISTLLTGGIFLGLAAGVPYPNTFRLIIVGITILFYFTLMALIRVILLEKRKITSYNILKGLAYFLILIFFVFLFSLYSLWPVLSNFVHYLTVTNQLSITYTGLEYTSSPINVFQNTIRLVYNGFLEESPYYRSYLFNPIIILLTLLWPLFVYILSPIFSHMRSNFNKDRSLFYLTVLVNILLILMVLWDTSINPPFGFIVKYLARNYPLLLTVYQVGFFSSNVLPAFYTTFVAYSIFEIYLYLKQFISNRNEKTGHKRNLVLKEIKKVAPALVSILVIFLIMVAAFPVFNGQMEGEFFNQSAKGTWIPNQYFTAKEIIKNDSGNILLLPGTSQYIQTSWNYEGTVDFYNSFFYPLNIFTFNSFGSYEGFNTSYIQNYINLTSPVTFNRSSFSPLLYSNTSILSGNNYSSLPLSIQYSNYGVWGANSSRNNSGLAINETNSGYVHIALYFLKNLNLSHFPYIRITYNVSTPQFFENATKLGYVNVGLGASNGIAFWELTPANTMQISNSTFESFLPLGYGYSSVYNQSNVTSFYLYIDMNAGSSIPSFNLSYPKMGGVNYTIDLNWLSLTRHLAIRYIIFDKTMVTGIIQPYNYVVSALQLLENYSVLSQIYHSTYIDIYTFNNNSDFRSYVYLSQGVPKYTATCLSKGTSIQILITTAFDTIMKRKIFRTLTNPFHLSD